MMPRECIFILGPNGTDLVLIPISSSLTVPGAGSVGILRPLHSARSAECPLIPLLGLNKPPSNLRLGAQQHVERAGAAVDGPCGGERHDIKMAAQPEVHRRLE